MLSHRLRCWANASPALGQHLVFAESALLLIIPQIMKACEAHYSEVDYSAVSQCPITGRLTRDNIVSGNTQATVPFFPEYFAVQS